MKLTVTSQDERIEVYHNTNLNKDVAFIYMPESTNFSVRHSEINSLIETLQLYKERMTEVLGAESIR